MPGCGQLCWSHVFVEEAAQQACTINKLWNKFTTNIFSLWLININYESGKSYTCPIPFYIHYVLCQNFCWFVITEECFRQLYLFPVWMIQNKFCHQVKQFISAQFFLILDLYFFYNILKIWAIQEKRMKNRTIKSFAMMQTQLALVSILEAL